MELKQEIISRKDAKARGLIHYFTGKPCKRGHIAVRYTLAKNCITCKISLRQENLKRYLKNERKAQQRNKIKRNAATKNWGNNNKEHVQEYRANYNRVNRSKIREKEREYAIKHPNFQRLKSARRKARKLQRTPSWSEEALIKELYLSCPANSHVDHIEPLKGELISGLHVHNNLQYLKPCDNLRKGNKFSPYIQQKNGEIEILSKEEWAVKL